MIYYLFLLFSFSPFDFNRSLNLYRPLPCHLLINVPATRLAAGSFFHSVTLVISALSGR